MGKTANVDHFGTFCSHWKGKLFSDRQWILDAVIGSRALLERAKFGAGGAHAGARALAWVGVGWRACARTCGACGRAHARCSRPPTFNSYTLGVSAFVSGALRRQLCGFHWVVQYH